VTINVNQLSYSISDIQAFICPGGSVVIGGEIYDIPGVYVDTLDGVGVECDTIRTITIDEQDYNQLDLQADLCPGASVTILGMVYDQPGTYTDTLPGAGGECDTIATIQIDPLPYNTATYTDGLCPGETVTINGVLYTAAGSYSDTLAGAGGACDTILSITPIHEPYENASVTAAIHE